MSMELTDTPQALLMEIDDCRLVRDALAGSREAFDLLVERHARRVFRLALSMLGRREDAEDVQQECFVSAYCGLRSFRGEASFGTWLCAIAARLCLSRRRKADWRTCQTWEDASALAVTADDDPGERLLAAESAARVQRTLAQLSPADRLLIVLRFIEGLSHEEIASVLGCSVGSSRSRLLRAKKLFRERYEMTE